jgi:hypothetical protein
MAVFIPGASPPGVTTAIDPILAFGFLVGVFRFLVLGAMFLQLLFALLRYIITNLSEI